MVKKITTAFSILFSLSAIIPAAAQKKGQSSGTTAIKPVPKFLDAIEIQTGDAPEQSVLNTIAAQPAATTTQFTSKPESNGADHTAIENASSLQLKYAVLLNTEVEAVQNEALFSAIDEWYGTRYALGGSTKDGIDCSAFVQAVYNKLFQIPMPRTAKEQYNAVRQISRSDLKQGDLVFFHTRGHGVSHVGIYIQNNKFVHAASSGGVMISDLSEDYWAKHFIGAGHYENTSDLQTVAVKP